jgi:hypothetical protein
MSILRDKNIYTVSQLLEVNDLTGRLTVDENRLLLADLSIYPHLQHKLRLLIHSLRRAPVVDKFVTQTTTPSSLFCLDKNLSQIFKQQQRHKLHKIIQVPPSYLTRQRDGLHYHKGSHFLTPTRSSTCRFYLPKLRKRFSRYCIELSGHKIRPISQDEYLTPFVTVVKKWRLWNICSIHSCKHYSAKIWDLAGKAVTLAVSHHSGDYVPAMVLIPLEIVFNKPHPSILLHVKDTTTRNILILFLQKIKQDIIYRRAQLQEPRQREELHPCIQAHLVSLINKVTALLEYQGTL